MHLSSNINYLRKRLGLTQKDLSVKLGIVSNQVGKYERGESEPPATKLVILAQIFDISIDDLVNVDLSEQAPTKAKKTEEQDTLKEVVISQQRTIERLQKMIREKAPELAVQLGLS